jgi:hypothetical protein
VAEPDPPPQPATAAAEEFVPVPPVDGIPGPLFFETPTLTFVPKGTLRVTAGARWLDDVELPYSGLAGDLLQLGIVRVDVGFGSRVEVRVQGAIQQRLEIDREGSDPRPPTDVKGDTTTDSGDFSILTIAQVMPERGWKPAFGLRVEVKLPNTNHARGIGTNTTDVLLSLPGRKRVGDVLLFSDLGIGILTTPRNAQRQTDVLLYGLAAAYEASPRWMFSGELLGRWSSAGGVPGTGNRGALHVGASWSSGSWAFGLILSRGFGEGGERFGATAAVSYGFRVFEKVAR